MLILLAAAVLGHAGEDTLASAVVASARSMLGRRVGAGRCTDLADEALGQAGAGRPGGAWGEERPSLREARPGDILQFEGCVFVARRVLPDGTPATITYRAVRHTAVVAAVRMRRGRPILTVLHQNAGFAGDAEGDREVVTEWTFDPGILRAGTLRAYRPVPARARDR